MKINKRWVIRELQSIGIRATYKNLHCVYDDKWQIVGGVVVIGRFKRQFAIHDGVIDLGQTV